FFEGPFPVQNPVPPPVQRLPDRTRPHRLPQALYNTGKSAAERLLFRHPYFQDSCYAFPLCFPIGCKAGRLPYKKNQNNCGMIKKLAHRRNSLSETLNFLNAKEICASTVLMEIFKRWAISLLESRSFRLRWKTSLHRL